jgi:hypothetical protein
LYGNGWSGSLIPILPDERWCKKRNAKRQGGIRFDLAQFFICQIGAAATPDNGRNGFGLLCCRHNSGGGTGARAEIADAG